MKRSLLAVLGILILAGLFLGAVSCIAEMKGDGKMAEEPGIKGCKTCGHDLKDGRMMGEMAERKVVATSDGGIVIVTEDAITKYDRDLKVVKVVELKAAAEPMHHGMMGKKGSGCPMMNKMMKNDKDAKEPAAAPVKK